MKPDQYAQFLPLQRPQQARGIALAFAAGLLFALGLVVSGMTQPAQVIGFLNLAGIAQGEFPGRWNPGLAFVMGGAVLVMLLAFRLTPPGAARPARKPWFGQRFELPTQQRIDAPLLQGAAAFGIGWGLAGYCPGPALASLLAGSTEIWLFVPAMLAGMWLARR